MPETLVSSFYKSGLADGEQAFEDEVTGVRVTRLALEVLNETVVEALEKAARYDPSRAPKPWLLGIAANIIKRKKADRAKMNRREESVEDRLLPGDIEAQNDAELFDQIAALDPGMFEAIAQDGPEVVFEATDSVAAMLRLIPAEDRRVISLAVVHGLDGEALALALRIKPGAARVRLHRALKRLREALDSKGGVA